MELQVQHFLRTAPRRSRTVDALKLLEAKYGIKTKRHCRYPNLVLFKYSQIDSPFSEPIVQECRGLILDEAADWAIIAHPYHKFFNYGETLAANIDWKTAQVQEKLDGSLITLYNYKGSWEIATSGCPDGENLVGDFGLTFKQKFLEVIAGSNIYYPDLLGGQHFLLNPQYTYMLELCCPENRVVVQHQKPRLVLHGIRDLATGLELRPLETPWRFVFETPGTYPLTSIEEALEAAKHLDPLQQEGYVVCDAQFNRVKVKSPAYLALHHAKDGLLSLKHMALIIRTGEAGELKTALAAFPELKPHFDELVARYGEIVQQANASYLKIMYIENQKEFAMAAQKEYYPGMLFAMRKSSCTPQAYMLKITEPAYLRLMETKNE
jgi:RNA ligase.